MKYQSQSNYYFWSYDPVASASLEMNRIRTKACDRCQINADILYRIKVDRADRWQFVCPHCWILVNQDHPDYVYGGTWKSRKR
jgi:hypothetical protein